jgi:phosphatidylglycerol:prolipoprotein diacylglycerol transferase
MFPYISVFGRQLGVYALAALCGLFAAGAPACVRAKRAGLDDTDMIVTLLAAAAGALAGGHLLYGLVQFRLFPRLFDAGSAAVFFARAGVIFGGQVFYGGLLGGLAAGAVCGRILFRGRLPDALDCIAPFVPLFHVFGRLGCFAAGCCFGVESRAGIVFTRALVPEANGTPRVPVQLIEAAFNLALFALLAARRPRPRGRLIYRYLLLYPAGRFILEFFRGDEYRGFWGPFSTSQWISLALAGFAVFALARPAKQGNVPRVTVLVGPKHSGKTCAGAALAELLGIPFYDLDALIERAAGASPRALYREGEAVFRAAEAAALKTLFAETGGALVLAAGGGVIDNPDAVRALNSAGAFVVYLDVDAGTAWERIAAGPLPPFLVNGRDDPEELHRRLHERRAAAYRELAGKNGLAVRGEGKTPRQIAGEIAAAFARAGVLS